MCTALLYFSLIMYSSSSLVISCSLAVSINRIHLVRVLRSGPGQWIPSLHWVGHFCVKSVVALVQVLRKNRGTNQ